MPENPSNDEAQRKLEEIVNLFSPKGQAELKNIITKPAMKLNPLQSLSTDGYSTLKEAESALLGFLKSHGKNVPYLNSQTSDEMAAFVVRRIVGNEAYNKAVEATKIGDPWEAYKTVIDAMANNLVGDKANRELSSLELNLREPMARIIANETGVDPTLVLGNLPEALQRYAAGKSALEKYR